MPESDLQREIRKELNDRLNQPSANYLEGAIANSRGVYSMDKTKANTAGLGFAGTVAALAMGNNDRLEAKKWARSKFGEDSVAYKALSSSSFEGGGALLGQPVTDDIIELLQNRTLIRRMRPVNVPLGDNTAIDYPKFTSGASADYLGENEAINKSEATFGHVRLDLKKLAALTVVSRDMIKSAPDAAVQAIRDNLVEEIRQVEDRELLRGDGTQSGPVGLRNLASSSNVTSTNGTSAANVEKDFQENMEKLEGNNVPLERPFWVMSSRSKSHLMTLRDGAGGNLIFPDIRSAQPMIWGYPVIVSNTIPNDLGGGNESEVYFIEASQVLFAQGEQIEVRTSDEAAYQEGGQMKSAWERDQTTIRAILRNDINLRHPEAVAVTTGVAYGT